MATTLLSPEEICNMIIKADTVLTDSLENSIVHLCKLACFVTRLKMPRHANAESPKLIAAQIIAIQIE